MRRSYVFDFESWSVTSVVVIEVNDMPEVMTPESFTRWIEKMMLQGHELYSADLGANGAELIFIKI